MKIEDRRLRPMFGWDSPLRGRQAWQFRYVDSFLCNRLCVTLADRGKGVPYFDEMVAIVLEEVNFDNPTTNMRGRRALAIAKPTP